MGPSIIPASQLGLTNRPCALKQRSPADGRRAVEKIHRIEKMNHCGITSLEVEAGVVKLTPMNSRRATREKAAGLVAPEFSYGRCTKCTCRKRCPSTPPKSCHLQIARWLRPRRRRL